VPPANVAPDTIAVALQDGVETGKRNAAVVAAVAAVS